jgi:hypothetical protein
LSAREQSSSALISVSSSFEKSSSARFYSNFNFTSRSYESSVKASDSIFLATKNNSKESSFESIRSNSILDFIEHSKLASVKSAQSQSILQFVLHSKTASQMQFVKSSALNPKSTSFDQFSSRSTTADSEKQTARTTVEYEISRTILTIESISEMSQKFIEIQRRKLMTMMQKF